jgi:hypothetical protein
MLSMQHPSQGSYVATYNTCREACSFPDLVTWENKLLNQKLIERFKVFMAVTILIMFFWVKSTCGLVGRSQRFEDTFCLHLKSQSDKPGLRGTMYIKWQWGKSEGKGQSEQMRQTLGQTN